METFQGIDLAAALDVAASAVTDAGRILLELRRKQLGKLIALARETLKTGVTPMKFDAFDKTEQARFAAEVKEKWGGTAAYQEYQQREENGSAGDSAELMAQFAELGKLKNLAPAAPEVQTAICKLQQFITSVRTTYERQAQAGEAPVLLTSPTIRPYVRSIVERFRPSSPVISQSEVWPKAKIKTIGRVA